MPGGENDPADDRQLVPFLPDFNGSGAACAFDFTVATYRVDSLRTRPLTAFYPVANSYAAYEARASAAVASAPDGCATSPATLASVRERVAVNGGRPLDGCFEQAGARSVAALAGATVRFYTTARAVAGEASPVAASGLRLGAPFPNPARGVLTVEITAATSGRLRVVDVLGRTVFEQRLDAGTRDVRIDTQRLAPGVYAIVLDAGSARVSRTVTVVR